VSTNCPRVVVIIPVYGNWEDTVQCLTALESQTTRDFQVLIADDGSPTPPPVDSHAFKQARYMKNEHVGFGPNCNRAAQQAIALGATHLLFLNNDTSFGPNFMEQWIRRASEMPQVILGPMIYWARHPGRIWFSGGRLTVFTPFVRSKRHFDKVTKVDTITGCVMLLPSGAWTALGGFDPKYAMYFEDLDLTLRAKENGIQTYVLPDQELYVLHHVSGSFRGSDLWRKQYFMLTSSLIFIRSHYRGIRKLICFGLSCAHLAITTLRSLPEFPNPRLLWRAAVRGFSD
jgi:GT2 family glycosyltransferase